MKALLKAEFLVVLLLTFALNACSSSDSAPTPSASPTPTPDPRITLSTFQAASVVIGQTDFTQAQVNQGGTPDSNTINGVYGNSWLNQATLFISDLNGNRILGFNSVPTSNNAHADFVVGQPNFTTGGGGVQANTTSNTGSVQAYKGKFFVSDLGNHRILIFNSIPTTSQPSADIAVGQVDLTAHATGICSAASLQDPYDFSTGGGKLIVSDSANGRVLIWNTIPTTSGVAADVVLGQADFTHCNTSVTASSTTINGPLGIWSDGTKLFVADSNNKRVLIWNKIPTVNQTAADLVLGQPDMISKTASTTNKGLAEPEFIISNGVQLFVSDARNNRILIWSQIPTSSYTAADLVLGQSDFTHSAANDDNQDGAADASPSARTFSFPAGMYVDPKRLVVSDSTNNRVLIFNGQ
ncbi:MAG: uncharacterized protein JWQ35_329 [Bacteriovoracaceae bacterium]|nr:uncharacterized protein [Bacteriovoracaceae bacterium]